MRKSDGKSFQCAIIWSGKERACACIVRNKKAQQGPAVELPLSPIDPPSPGIGRSECADLKSGEKNANIQLGQYLQNGHMNSQEREKRSYQLSGPKLNLGIMFFILLSCYSPTMEINSAVKEPTGTLLSTLTGIRRSSAVSQTRIFAFFTFSKTPPISSISGSRR